MKDKTELKTGLLLLPQMSFETTMVHTQEGTHNQVAVSGEQHLAECLQSNFYGIHHMRDMVVTCLSNNPCSYFLTFLNNTIV